MWAASAWLTQRTSSALLKLPLDPLGHALVQSANSRRVTLPSSCNGITAASAPSPSVSFLGRPLLSRSVLLSSGSFRSDSSFALALPLWYLRTSSSSPPRSVSCLRCTSIPSCCCSSHSRCPSLTSLVLYWYRIRKWGRCVFDFMLHFGRSSITVLLLAIVWASLLLSRSVSFFWCQNMPTSARVCNSPATLVSTVCPPGSSNFVVAWSCPTPLPARPSWCGSTFILMPVAHWQRAPRTACTDTRLCVAPVLVPFPSVTHRSGTGRRTATMSTISSSWLHLMVTCIAAGECAKAGSLLGIVVFRSPMIRTTAAYSVRGPTYLGPRSDFTVTPISTATTDRAPPLIGPPEP